MGTERVIAGRDYRGQVWWAGGGWSADPAKACVNDDATEGGAGRTARNLRIAERHAKANHVADVRIVVVPNGGA